MADGRIPDRADVVVVGSGNAGLSAALSAAEAGAQVLLVEKAPERWFGGNSYFTAGAFRIALEDQDTTLAVLRSSGSEPELRPGTEVPTYPEARYRADFDRLTGGRGSHELSRVLIEESTDTARWLGGHGVPWILMYERQAHHVAGTWRFWGGLFVGVDGQGPVLVDRLREACQQHGVTIVTGAPCLEVRVDDAARHLDGVVVLDPDLEQPVEVDCDAVIMASGGFEADPRLRAAYLGAGWDSAHVRGTPHNTGELLDRSVRSFARSRGQWSGAHAVAWDAGTAADEGDREVSNRATKQGYWLGVVVNQDGRRFLDEGADFRNFTYAKYGREILRQPGARAFQIFDQRTIGLVNETEYTSPSVRRFEADSLPELAAAAGLPVDAFLAEMTAYNHAIDDDQPFDPTVLDGRRADVEPPKSNWAQPLTDGPYIAFEVTCGVTFTFGGFATDAHGQVHNHRAELVDGVYAAGETVGGLFYDNYPGGTGLMSGAVFGRRAGRAATQDRAVTGAAR